MPATGYYAKVCTVESDLWAARRSRGKRPLLVGLCGAVAVEWALRARKSRFWRFLLLDYFLDLPHLLRAL